MYGLINVWAVYPDSYVYFQLPAWWQPNPSQYASALDACFCLRHCENSKPQCIQEHISDLAVNVSKTEWDLLTKYRRQCCKSQIDKSYENSAIYGGYRLHHPFVYDLYATKRYCSWASKLHLQEICSRSKHKHTQKHKHKHTHH